MRRKILESELESEFWKRVEKLANESGCWIWTGSLKTTGYGKLADLYAHRLSYKIHYGEIGDLWVLHHCDTPCCVNPNHLFLGTVADNTKDAAKKGRMRRGEAQHKAVLTENLVREIRTLSNGGLSSRKIAKKFGVGRSTIKHVLKGTTWKHVI